MIGCAGECHLQLQLHASRPLQKRTSLLFEIPLSHAPQAVQHQNAAFDGINFRSLTGVQPCSAAKNVTCHMRQNTEASRARFKQAPLHWPACVLLHAQQVALWVLSQAINTFSCLEKGAKRKVLELEQASGHLGIPATCRFHARSCSLRWASLRSQEVLQCKATVQNLKLPER